MTFSTDTPHSGPIKPVHAKPVLIGAVMTWLGGVLGIMAGSYLLIPRLAAEQVADLGLDAELIDSYATLGAVVLAWSVMAIIGATAAFRGYRWGSIVLLILALLASFFMLFAAAAVGSFELLILVGYIAIATAMFFLPVSTFFYRASYRYRTA